MHIRLHNACSQMTRHASLVTITEIKEMKKKNLTINEIESKIKKMGGIVISDKEFSSSDEFKNLHDYVERIFRRTKQGLAPKRRQPQKD